MASALLFPAEIWRQIIQDAFAGRTIHVRVRPGSNQDSSLNSIGADVTHMTTSASSKSPFQWTSSVCHPRSLDRQLLTQGRRLGVSNTPSGQNSSGSITDFLDDRKPALDTDSESCTLGVSGILFSCWALHHETVDILYRLNTFHLDIESLDGRCIMALQTMFSSPNSPWQRVSSLVMHETLDNPDALAILNLPTAFGELRSLCLSLRGWPTGSSKRLKGWVNQQIQETEPASHEVKPDSLWSHASRTLAVLEETDEPPEPLMGQISRVQGRETKFFRSLINWLRLSIGPQLDEILIHAEAPLAITLARRAAEEYYAGNEHAPRGDLCLAFMRAKVATPLGPLSDDQSPIWMPLNPSGGVTDRDTSAPDAVSAAAAAWRSSTPGCWLMMIPPDEKWTWGYDSRGGSCHGKWVCSRET